MKIKILLISVLMCFLAACGNDSKNENTIVFGTSLDYPPFEYYENGVPAGFDVELAYLVGEQLGKKVVIQDIQFSSILASIQNGAIDAGIATITYTEDRAKAFDLSYSYYNDKLAAIFLNEKPITSKLDMNSKKIACQIGTTTEIWLKKNVPTAILTLMDNNNQVIEAVKAGHVDIGYVDGAQAISFTKENPMLSYTAIAESDDGFSIAVKKGSPLLKDINSALAKLKKNGKLKELKNKWFKE